MNHRIVPAVVFGFFVFCSLFVIAAEAEVIKFDKDDAGWTLERDWGRNKTKGELTAVKGIEGNSDGIKLSADFTSGKGSYAAAVKNFESLKAKSIDEIKFKLRTENTKTYTLRVIDATGQTLQRRPQPILDGEWADVVINNKTFARNEHYKGANDGKIHQPIKKIEIALTKASSDDKKPVVEIYDLSAKVQK